MPCGNEYVFRGLASIFNISRLALFFLFANGYLQSPSIIFFVIINPYGYLLGVLRVYILNKNMMFLADSNLD